MNGEFRIVPKIDLAGFEHKISQRKITLKEGILVEGGTAWDDERSRLDTRPVPSAAMIKEAIRIDQKQLEGTWKLISGSIGSQSQDAKANGWCIITGDKVVMDLPNRWEGKFTLDPAKSPRRINLVSDSPDGQKGEEVRGVYELRGDDLIICLAFGDDPRPTSLRPSKDTGQISLVLRREKKP